MTDAVFLSPLYLVVRKQKGKWKKDHINLNNYHNWHFGVRNSLKIAYSQNIRSQICGQRFKNVDLELTLFPKDKRKRDRSNILCLHEKFACDALVQAGVIPDDNDHYINSTLYKSGEIDKENPRVEIKLRPAKVAKNSTEHSVDI